MAKKKQAQNQITALPEYGELIGIMQNETASIVSDYIRQYVGVVAGNGIQNPNQPAIYMNQDRVQRFQTYQELAFYDLYAEVARDPHVIAILSSAKLNVAGMKYDVNAYTEGVKTKPSARNQQIADFVKGTLKNLGHFPSHLYNMLDAIGMGFSVSEIIWDITPDGIIPKEILNRPQRRFQFDATDRSLRVRNIEAPFYGKPLPDKKFIVFKPTAQWDNPFGDALLQSLYWMWLFKKTVLKFWMQHLQVGASSIPIVKHPASASATLKAEALEIAKMIRNGAYGRLPDNFEILWAESENAALNAEAYQNFNRMCNDEMSKCVNGQILTAEASSGTGMGTRALGSVHAGVQSARDVFRAEALASTLNKTLIKWIVDFNFASVDGYPEFRFDLEEPDDLVKEAQIIKSLSDAGYEFDETELSDKFNYQIKKKEKLDLTPANPLDKKDELEEEPDSEGEEDAKV